MVNQHVDSSASVLVGVSVTSGVGVATGVLDQLNYYAPVIGMCLSVFSICIAITIFLITRYDNKKRTEKYEIDLRNKIKAEIIIELGLNTNSESDT